MIVAVTLARSAARRAPRAQRRAHHSRAALHRGGDGDRHERAAHHVRHLLPNALPPLIVQATYICASAVLIEAALSFLGAGTPPEIPSWGNIMAEAAAYFQLKPWMVLLPGLFLARDGAGDQPGRRRAARHARSATRAADVMSEHRRLAGRSTGASESAHAFPHARRRRQGRGRRVAVARPRRNAGRRRRERLRQVASPRCRSCASCRPTAGRIVAGSIRFERHGTADARSGRDARDSRQPDRHDLPGADDELEPGHDGRPADRGNASPCTSSCREARRFDRAIEMLDAREDPRARGGCVGTIRTSSPAACGSA